MLTLDAKRTVRRLAAAVLAGGVLIGLGAAARPAAAQNNPRFSVVDLGTLRTQANNVPSNDSRAFAIAPNGDITGEADSDSNALHAFTWKNGARVDLGTLGGVGSRSTGLGINNTGLVTGVTQDANGRTRAFRFSNGLIQDLGTLGGSNSQGLSINAQGQIAGSANNGQDKPQAVIFQTSAITPIGTLSGGSSTAFGINDLSRLVGEARLSNGHTVPFLSNGAGLTQMPTLGGLDGRLTAINAGAVMVGESKTAAGQNHAYRISGSNVLDLGTLGGAASHAFAINADGSIVGAADNLNGNANAFLWEPAVGIQNLNNLIHFNAGWVLQEAHGINDSGLIAGFGINPVGNTRGFLLVPQLLQSLSFNPNPVIGGQNATGRVTISGPASVDLPITIAFAAGVNDGNVSFPGTVVIPRGQSSATFTVSTLFVNANRNVPLRAIFSGVEAPATLTLQPPVLQSLSFSPSTVLGGSTATGQVTIAGTPAQDLTVSIGLAPDVTDSTVSFPGSVTIRAGRTTATFQVTTQAVAQSHTVPFRAAFNGVEKQASLILRPIGIRSVSVSPTSVAGGLRVDGLVTLEAPAAPGAISVSLTSSNTTAAPLRNAGAGGVLTVSAAAGASTVPFTIITTQVTTSTNVTITAAANGSSKTTQLTVRLPRISTFNINGQVVGGGRVTGGVRLETAAPAGGVRVVVGTDPAFAVCEDLQHNQILSFIIPQGNIAGSFLVETKVVSADRTITVQAAANGSLKSGSVLIKKARLSFLELKDNPVVTGFDTDLTVHLDGIAAEDRTVNLSSSDTGAATLPSSVTIHAGSDHAKVTVHSKLIAFTTTVTLTATNSGDTRRIFLKVQALGSGD